MNEPNLEIEDLDPRDNPATEESKLIADKLKLYSRDTYGLIRNAKYVFNEDMTINWKAMIKPEHLYINREWFDNRKLAIPTSIEGLEDRQLLIMLGGIKELAKLRGFLSVHYDINHVSENYVSARCDIEWLPNYESNYEIVRFQDVASAKTDNTDAFGLKFIESIACNRAFVRCVRNFLNIHIVGADELDKSIKTFAGSSIANSTDSLANSTVLPITAQATLQKTAHEKLNIADFSGFKDFLRNLFRKAQEANDTSVLNILSEAKDWNDFKDIPAKSARILLKTVNEHPQNNQP
jgi:hypothetical protein